MSDYVQQNSPSPKIKQKKVGQGKLDFKVGGGEIKAGGKIRYTDNSVDMIGIKKRVGGTMLS